MFQKLDKLLAVEIISLTFVIASGVSSIMMMAKLPKYTDFLFSAPNILTSFLMLLLYILPSILKLTVPVSLLLSCAIVIMRMSADRELEAWMSCGVSVYRFAFMPSLLGVGVTLISLFSALYFEPYSNKQFEKYKWVQSRTLVESFIKMNLKEKSFIYDFRDSHNFPVTGKTKLVLYFGEMNSAKSEMEKAFLSFSDPNHQYSSFIVANTAKLNKESILGYPDYIFKLYDGYIYSYQEGKNPISTLISPLQHTNYIFDSNLKSSLNENLFPPSVDWTVTQFSEIDLSLVSLFKDKFKLDMEPQNHTDQLYPAEYFKMLNEEKSKHNDWKKDSRIIGYILYIFKQISVPISTLFLPFIGVCLGILDPRKKQVSVYFGIGLVIFALYASMSLCQQLALKFYISPYFMIFSTPLILFLISLILLKWRLNYPPSMSFFEFLKIQFLAFSRRKI